MGIRSFLAFDLTDEIRGIVSRTAEAMRRYDLDLRWVNPGGIHLTLVFMGDISPSAIPKIEETVGQVCRGFGPFALALEGAGVFPGRKRPRVLWLGLTGEIRRLSGFRQALHNALMPLGIREEAREFRPHLTLGRFRKGPSPELGLDEALARFGELKGPPWTLRELHLFKSDLKPEGAVYTKLQTWPLSGPG
jgi:2'-5' RNA ligase